MYRGLVEMSMMILMVYSMSRTTGPLVRDAVIRDIESVMEFFSWGLIYSSADVELAYRNIATQMAKSNMPLADAVSDAKDLLSNKRGPFPTNKARVGRGGARVSARGRGRGRGRWNRMSIPVNSNICFNYSEGFCDFYPCKYLHICAGCGGNHPFRECGMQRQRGTNAENQGNEQRGNGRGRGRGRRGGGSGRGQQQVAS